MGLYRDHIFPYVLDWGMRLPTLVPLRRRVLAPASGRVLEIGFGTGVNLSYYPESITAIDALDPESLLEKRVARRIEASGVGVQFHQLAGENLPFADNSFDTVVCTLTLCSVQDPARVLHEIQRVLKPGGRFLFLEHGASPDASVYRWQQRLNGIQQCCGGGCQIVRPIRQLIEQIAGWRLERIEQYYLPNAPRFLGYMSEGAAIKRI
jgi:ubiquinone/menaquinone biosynthesis C-methylase UbiE